MTVWGMTVWSMTIGGMTAWGMTVWGSGGKLGISSIWELNSPARIMVCWTTGSSGQQALKVGSVNAGKVGSAARIGLLELARPIDIHDQGAGLVRQVHPCRIADELALT